MASNIASAHPLNRIFFILAFYVGYYACKLINTKGQLYAFNHKNSSGEYDF